VKANVTGENDAGQCWLRVDKPNAQRGFFDNMDDRPIRAPSWNVYEITGKVERDAEKISFGCLLRGAGQVWVDEVQLSFKNEANSWAPIEIKNSGFEEVDAERRPAGWTTPNPNFGYTARVSVENPYKGKKTLLISATPRPNDRFNAVGWS